MKKINLAFLALALLLILNSCIGLGMDIQVKRDGTGRVNLEYQLSNMAEVIGRLDGNEMWPVVPVGREDWQRSVQRIGGITLVSFSSREGRGSTIYSIVLDFDNMQSLVNLLDPFGSRISYSTNGSKKSLEFILSERTSSSEINTGLLALTEQIMQGYKFEITFSANSRSAIRVDGRLPQSAQTVLSGRKVSVSVDMADLLKLNEELAITINW